MFTTAFLHRSTPNIQTWARILTVVPLTFSQHIQKLKKARGTSTLDSAESSKPTTPRKGVATPRKKTPSKKRKVEDDDTDELANTPKEESDNDIKLATPSKRVKKEYVPLSTPSPAFDMFNCYSV